MNGKKIRYIVRDDHGIVADSAKLVEGLISQDRADYLMGAIGTEATQAIIATPAFRQSKLVLFAPLADSVAVTGERAQFWRPGIEREFEFILSYFQNLGVQRVGIALQQNAQNARPQVRRRCAEKARHRAGYALPPFPPRFGRQRPGSEASGRQRRQAGHHDCRYDCVGPVPQGLPQARSLNLRGLSTSLINLETLAQIPKHQGDRVHRIFPGRAQSGELGLGPAVRTQQDDEEVPRRAKHRP
ncbi:ABC transporter substrate-binding protein [Massilia sp. B-10]|nr:ABC transporter substrate-binding protein [Massilia sp. B-10]